ncbi:hypothetical protein GUY61_14715 [Streptomyces sp. GC420]|nr:hypothetical protein [Streptomyces sp. GC420]
MEQVRTVRRFTSQTLTNWGLGDDDRGAAVLIVSELAGNAARHGQSDMEILLALAGSALHLVVADSGGSAGPSADPSAGRFHGPEEHYGRGLNIVRSLAERLTVRQDPEGWRGGVLLRTGTVRGNHQQVGAEGEWAVTDVVAEQFPAEPA